MIHSSIICTMVGYYDVVLGLIPLTLLGVTGSLSVGGVPTVPAVTIGALIATAFVGHALFVNGPGDELRA